MFTGKNRNEVFETIEHYDENTYIFPKDMDSDLVDLLKKLVNKEAYKRIGIKRMHEIKNHPFFKGIDFK